MNFPVPTYQTKPQVMVGWLPKRGKESRAAGSLPNGSVWPSTANSDVGSATSEHVNGGGPSELKQQDLFVCEMDCHWHSKRREFSMMNSWGQIRPNQTRLIGACWQPRWQMSLEEMTHAELWQYQNWLMMELASVRRKDDRLVSPGTRDVISSLPSMGTP
ncbi:hypothetical protein HYFRA_00009488 [Hymenoscyphus fraxineus]|uniref:Uncharacterized protein n=1 Tax=Hymenoscyphus fraxineus TaxID=746836 RepID=A0A9N9PJ96_9HELO|nr:hypothetical protein HYFRA_00009488 [Hymenoscyphus fraxineus]